MPQAVELARAFLTNVQQGDIASALAMVAPDAQWKLPLKKGELARDYVGPEGVRTFLTNVTKLSGGSFSLELISVVGDESIAFVHFIGRAERNGKTLENPTALRLRFSDGQLKEANEWVWDLPTVERFWG